MEMIILNGRMMDTKEKAHKYIKNKLFFPNYYGENLDALWDVLTETRGDLDIKLINHDFFLESLGDYGLLLVKTFEDASIENKNIRFKII